MNLYFITDLKTGKDFCVRAKSQTDGIRLVFANMTIREEPVRSSYQKGLKSKYDARFSGHLVGTEIGEYEDAGTACGRRNMMQEEGRLEMGKMLEDATAAMTLEAVLEGLEAAVAASEGRSCFGTDTLANPYTVSLVLKGADGEAKALMDSKGRVLEKQWPLFGHTVYIYVAAPGTEGNPCTNTYRICVDGGTLADVGVEAVVPVLAALIAGCHQGTRIGQDMERDSQRRRIGPRYVRSNGCADNISFYGEQSSGIADNISYGERSSGIADNISYGERSSGIADNISYGEQIRSSGIADNISFYGEQIRSSGIADNISFYGEQIRSSGISCNFGKMDGCHGEQARSSDTSFEQQFGISGNVDAYAHRDSIGRHQVIGQSTCGCQSF